MFLSDFPESEDNIYIDRFFKSIAGHFRSEQFPLSSSVVYTSALASSTISEHFLFSFSEIGTCSIVAYTSALGSSTIAEPRRWCKA